MKLWQIGALVVAGLVLGEIRPGAFTDLFRSATLYVFLPALIFEAAWQLDARLMRTAWRPIVLLALPGVAVTALIVAAAVHWLGGLALAPALVLGAVLSATDPVAVVAIFRRLSVPPLLATIVESESLLNDAVAVVAYRAIIGALLVSASLQAEVQVSAIALLGTVAGIACGVVLGYLGSFVLRRGIPTPVQIGVTFGVAYAAYFVSERFEWSGIFAVIASAIVLRELERRYESVDVALGVERAWHVAATLANAGLFFLVGAAVETAHLWAVRELLLWTLAAVLVARVALAYGLLALAPPMARSWRVVVRLAGVRGALSLALALGIPAEIPQRATVVDATFMVVIFTVLVGALTYERRIERLDLEPHA
ncbi:MAG: sodium:proton antiporter [bacterium]|nr:sodium:proton antiporter [bacterium]